MSIVKKKEERVEYLNHDGRSVPGISDWQKGYLCGLVDAHFTLREELYLTKDIKKACDVIEKYYIGVKKSYKTGN